MLWFIIGLALMIGYARWRNAVAKQREEYAASIIAADVREQRRAAAHSYLRLIKGGKA